MCESIHPGAATGLPGREPLEGLVRDQRPAETEGEEDHPRLSDAHEDNCDERGREKQPKETPGRDRLDEDDKEAQDDEEDDETVQTRGREIREDRHPRADGLTSG